MKKGIYIIADTTDNTITLSEEMCQELEVTKGLPRIFVFKLSNSKEYAFKRVSTKFSQRTVSGVISKNPVLNTFGFVSNCPTVNLMFYEMNIKSKQKKLKIEKQTLPDESTIYVIKPPKKFRLWK